MNKKDLDILKNRTAAFVQKKTGKLPRCSTYLRRKAADLVLEIRTEGSDTLWAVFEAGAKQPVFIGPNYLKTVGWIFANQLYKGRIVSSPGHYQEISDFMVGFYPRPDEVFSRDPEPELLVVLFKRPLAGGDSFVSDILMFNSWGEVYFDSISLSGIESLTQKCYKIADYIFNVQQKKKNPTLQHLICHPDEDRLRIVKDQIRQYLQIIGQNNIGPDPLAGKEEPDEEQKPIKKNKPFLDLL